MIQQSMAVLLLFPNVAKLCKDIKPSGIRVASHISFIAAVTASREVPDGVARHGVIALTAHIRQG